MSIDIAVLLTLKNELEFKIRPGFEWHDSPEKLIGVNDHDSYPKPYMTPFPYIVISTGDKYVFPSSYMLQGRKKFDGNYLISWMFEGLRYDGKWDLLHSCTNCTFSNSEIRKYPIKTRRGYSAFNITMTEKDSINEYALCLGQIEVYGIIGNGAALKNPNHASCHSKYSRSSYVFIFTLIANTK